MQLGKGMVPSCSNKITNVPQHIFLVKNGLGLLWCTHSLSTSTNGKKTIVEFQFCSGMQIQSVFLSSQGERGLGNSKMGLW